jgi:hypothetical protein
MKEKNLKIHQKNYIIQVKLFFQILKLNIYHFVNIFQKNGEQLLVRPIEIYEFPHSIINNINFQKNLIKIQILN